MIGAAMRIVKVGVLAPTNKGIPLGVQGENRATEVEFDTRPWFREYPHGTVSAVARRYGDQAPYPLSLDVADGTAVWQVSDTDTAKAGDGAVELTMTNAGTRVRSLTFKTLVTASLTDSPVDDDAWYGWLDKAVVKVDETVQSAQRKMAEVDDEWTGLKADVTAKVDECGKVAAQAASDAHHAKVDAQATAKALESAEGSVAKAEAAANRAVDAALDADDSAVEASKSEQSAGESASEASSSADAAANSAGDAATSASNAADAASAASGSASAAEQSATDANSAKVAAQTAKADAATSASNAATSASSAADSATAAAKSASDAASVGDKTLAEAKKYTDANTSNALVGKVSGKLLHVEDAWPSKPLSVTNDGAYKQDGTPSPDNPVPIQVIENPVIKVVGRNLFDRATLSPNTALESNTGEWYKSYSGNWYANRTKLPFAFVAGLTLTMSVASSKETTSVFFYDKNGAYISRVYFKANVHSFVVPENTAYVAFEMYTAIYNAGNVSLVIGSEGKAYSPYTHASIPITLPAEHPYLAALPDGTHDEIVIDKDGNASLVARVGKTETAATDGVNATVGTDALSSTGALADGATVYYKLDNQVTYTLEKLDIPALPETISNVWTDAELTTNMSMTYKRDINIAFDNLVQAVVAAAAGE